MRRIHIGAVFVLVLFQSAHGADRLIDLSDRNQINSHRPILIAHRGGVITPSAPECSMAAVRLAAEAGYAMVELDIQRSRDGAPIIFHDETLEKVCSRAGRVADYAMSELVEIHYAGTSQKVVALDAVLALCQTLRLGVMLDLKEGLDDQQFLTRIDQMIVRHGLVNATVSISRASTARKILRHVMFTATNEQMALSKQGKETDLSGSFWFGLPKDISDEEVSRLQASGALVFPAINTFRYPKVRHRELARRDIERLVRAGVDGFQIDSIYSDLLNAR